MQPSPTQFVLTGDNNFVRNTQLTMAWDRLHLNDLWCWHASAEVTLESQSSAVVPVSLSLNGGVRGGGICTGCW